MARRFGLTNPFYPLLVVVSIVFVITACADCVLALAAISPRGNTAHPLLAFLDRHGMVLLMWEVAVLAAVSLLAMGTDRYWDRRAQQRRGQ